MRTCEDCKYYNIDDKDGSISTMYPFCELEIRTSHEMVGDKSKCRKFRPFMRCNCKYGRELNKKWHQERRKK